MWINPAELGFSTALLVTFVTGQVGMYSSLTHWSARVFFAKNTVVVTTAYDKS